MMAAPTGLWADQPSVHVTPPDLHGSRALEPATRQAVVRDYLQAWQSFRSALNQNQAQLLDQDFIGDAREKLGKTVQEQARLGIHTAYQDQSHDLQIVFYSLDGLSVQIIDNVDYSENVFGKDNKLLATHGMHARYVVVLTPAAARWQVRVLQAQPPQ
jgi:hypothetical protein